MRSDEIFLSWQASFIIGERSFENHSGIGILTGIQNAALNVSKMRYGKMTSFNRW